MQQCEENGHGDEDGDSPSLAEVLDVVYEERNLLHQATVSFKAPS
jgi:hypothetical protein